MSLIEHLVAIVVGVVLPVAAMIKRRGPSEAAEPLDSDSKIAIYWSNAVFLGLLVALALGASWYGGRSAADLGLVFPGVRLGLGAGIAATLLVLFAIDSAVRLSPARIEATRDRWRRDTPFMPATPREVGHSMAMVVSAAVGEEILYRGFLIGYLLALLGGWSWAEPAAVALPALVFGISHLYQGWRATLKIIASSILFGAIVVTTGSIWLAVVVHFVIDLVGSLLGPRLMAPSR